MDPVSKLIAAWKIPMGQFGKSVFDFVTDYFQWLFDAISSVLGTLVDGHVGSASAGAAGHSCRRLAGFAYWLRRSKPLAIGVLLGFLFILNQGLWKETVQTLVLVVAATALSMAIGVPLGIWAAHKPAGLEGGAAAARSDADDADVRLSHPHSHSVRPRRRAGLIVTIIFAMPAPVRMTYLGLTSIPKPMLEAGESFGATKRQLLWKVELPAALPTIMAGLTQCIMLSLSMVVFATLIGAPSLGNPVNKALANRNIPLGIEAGLRARHSRHHPRPRARPFKRECANEHRCRFQERRYHFRQGRRRRRWRMVDAGATRAEILAKTGAVLGAAGANLTVNEGEISVLMGLSGSGKSTLLRAVNGLNKVSRGAVLVKDGDRMVDIVSCDAATLRHMRQKQVAMVFQQFALLPWRTVRENVGLGLELAGVPHAERKERVDRQLKLVGLDTWAEKYAHELSGGMQQRVGLARAFATEAPILLMDEPFSALDPLIRTKLQDELLQLQKSIKKTIIFVSHDLEEALKIGNRITIMEGGRIVQSGRAGRDRAAARQRLCPRLHRQC